MLKFKLGCYTASSTSRGARRNCGPSTREQCLPASRQPPGSLCCLSLLAGGFRPTTPYHIEMGTYILIDSLWAGGSVAPAQPTSLRWNWRIFAQTCSTCLEGPYRKDSSGAHPNGHSCYRIQNQDFSIPNWNRGTEYYPVRMKTHIEYPDIFFLKI